MKNKRPSNQEAKDKLKSGELVEQYRCMVFGLAKKFKNQYPNEDLQELASEGFMAIVEKTPEYDPDKSSMATWLHMCIWSRMKKMCVYVPTHRHIPTDLSMEGSHLFPILKSNYQPGILQELNEDASFLANLVLEAPAELRSLLSDSSPRKSQSNLCSYLRKKLKWSERKIICTWYEIADCLA